MKIINGGIYGIDYKGNISLEYGNSPNNNWHYAIIVRTYQDDLFLSFPITTSNNKTNKKGNIINPFAGGKGVVLLQQTRPISKNRIKIVQEINGKPCVLTEDELTFLIDQYKKYLDNRLLSVGMSVNEYHKKNNRLLKNFA